ncbi:uncharacterized protein SPPG_03888 [Spizellomyces punctatus DAOM BR117]|uniref:DUF1264 domain-containing protein n=1 Tax=Spizellomyces punctatus (strain DAOM BR117) TaxID=645134 RepID=A0A0L0HIQ8_SPIPD|nr:uncharacterized protein SPPG_03888 [Spizellomyces punctatus DAOM BR117]KND00775.1 hypothetical protein SPPG_03888 [Spizellomyces punctatus DAOM BR117]|eukprot:XP_016608814.1 hypothetical protein SPPG_03888 [Spizellomyces punctatus DAOM BR117]
MTIITMIGDGYKVPGEEPSLETTAMGLGAKAVQSFTPLEQICRHLCGFHVYAHDMTRQVEAHHYCSHLSSDMLQCVIYDSPEKDARLIGVEYIISSKLYNDLPESEKVYWHSHTYEVKGGILTLPVSRFVPAAVHEEIERKELSKVVNTYGKTWHLWQIDRGDILPYGPPSLMMSFTSDNQIDPKLLEQRDKREGVRTEDLIERRKDIPIEPRPPGAQEKLLEEKMAWQAKMEKIPLLC